MALLLLLMPALAQAQTETRPGVTTYAAAWFAGQQPGTALDMLALLPGFRLEEGDTALRGLSGTAGNVLIDGALPAGKEESLDTILQRIPAAAVARIELIRPGAGIDMRGHPLLANVVRATGAALRGRLELEEAVNHYGMTAPRAAAHLTLQGADDTLDLSASYGREWNGNHGFGRRDRFAADGTVLTRAAYAQPELQIAAEASAQYRRPLLGGTLTLGGVVKQQVEYSDIVERTIFPAAALAGGRDRERARGLEAQLHYQRPLADLGNWELFLLHRMNEEASLSRASDAGGTDLSTGNRALRETVARGQARVTLGALSLEAGAEGAINAMRSRNALERGGVAVTLPAARVRVEERRGELFAQGTWHAAPGLTLEIGARYEFSRIGQSGDGMAERDLSFFKPRLLASWRPLDGMEVRLLAERRVGQLDFDGFVSSASLSNGTVSAGNRDLSPDRTQRLELAWEQHFWERAALTLTLRRDAVAGVLDHLAIVTPAGVFDAIGNAGNGRRDEAQVALTLPLDRLGLAGMTLQADGTLRHSRLADPLTGAGRRFSGSEPLEGRLAFTHDLPSWNLRWGWDFRLATAETDYRIDEIDRRHHVSRLGAFVEYRPAPAWTVRLFGQDLAQPSYVRERLLYDGLRSAAPPDRREVRALNNGALLGLNMRFDLGG
jgi:outer membrane receptor protein involved in Fe transport